MKEKYKTLFTPLSVGNMMLRNRIVAAPMGIVENHRLPSSTNYGGMSAWDRSMGGAALVHICGEGSDIFQKYQLDTTKEQINVAKQDGAKVSCELGLFSLEPDEQGYCRGPMDGIRFDGCPVKAMTAEDMDAIARRVAKTCRNAKKIGFDAVTLHFGHDSLCSQFLSPVWNRREDAYGGNLENRCRFPLEALKTIRQAVGEDFPLILRVSRQLIVPETFSEDDMLYFIRQAEELIDMVNISCGMDVYHEGNVHAVPTIFEPHNYNAGFARRVKESTKVPVCLVGAVMNPEEAARLIGDGVTDCCMFGRSLIADPYWPKKLLNDREEDIVPCIRCMNCYHIATEHWNVQCSVNPRFRRENRMELKMPFCFSKKQVVVVGAGVAGMTAALSAGEQGHHVTLLEKEDALGGLLRWAGEGPFKEDLRAYLAYLKRQIEKSDIDVRLNTTVTAGLLEALKPDRLILALGSGARSLNVPGAERMLDACDAIAHPERLGQNVVIIGGGSNGCELGLEWALEGKEVTIIEMTEELASNGNELYRIGLRQHMERQKNLHILTGAVCQAVEEGRVLVSVNGETKILPCDTVVNAAGRVSNSEEAKALYGICADTVLIGDCERPGAVVDAVNQAYFVGKSL